MKCQWCESPADGKMEMGYGHVPICRKHFDYCTAVYNKILTWDDRPSAKNKPASQRWIKYDYKVLEKL